MLWQCWRQALAGALAWTAVAASAGTPQEEFDRLFGDDYRRVTATPTRLDDVGLARRLVELVRTSRLKPPLTAFLCERVCDLTEESSAGRPLALEALGRLREIRPDERLVWAGKQARIREAQLRAATGAGRRTCGRRAAQLWTEVADGDMVDGRYADAIDHYERALVLAQYYHPAMYQEIRAELEDARFQHRTQARVAELQRTLKASPDDVAARGELVRLFLIHLDDPRRAADHLGSDETGDLARNTRLAARGTAGLAPTPSLALAEWYVSLADGAPERSKPPMLLRAKSYYERYLRLYSVEDLTRAKAKLELRRIDQLLMDLSDREDRAPARAGKPIDLLAQVRLSRDAISGRWTLEKGILRVHPFPPSGSRITVPVVPGGDYQLLLDVRRFAGDDSCNIGLPVGKTHVTLIVDGERGTTIGLGDIDGVKYFDAPAARKLALLRDGKPHRIAVQVRTRSDRAQIVVQVDGKTATRWTGPLASLSPDKGVPPAKPQAFLFGSTRTGYEFRTAQLRALTGTARHLYKP